MVIVLIILLVYCFTGVYLHTSGLKEPDMYHVSVPTMSNMQRSLLTVDRLSLSIIPPSVYPEDTYETKLLHHSDGYIFNDNIYGNNKDISIM